MKVLPNTLPPEPSKLITIKISRRIHEQAKKAAYIRGMKLARIVEFAILDYLNLNDH